MIVRFETAIPDDPGSALARAEALLRRYGFVRHGEVAGVYVRASRWGTGGGLHPRQVRATVRFALSDRRAEAELRTDPMRGPVSALDRHVWRGEMDDLRAAVEGVPGPGLDRRRENGAAGILTGVVAIVLLAVLVPLGIQVADYGVRGTAPLLGLGLLGYVAVFALYVFLPLRMPRYLAETGPENLSNYPR